jgi:EmrB/QacA subfamily drug resistance transporter
MSVQRSMVMPMITARPRFGPVFAVVAAGVAMSNLDILIVNVALPQIGLHFRGSALSTLSWILNAYAVIFAALMVPAGSLADRLGARGTYLLGNVVFTIASILCAVAPGVWWLIGFRVLQAAGAAMFIPASLGILLAVAPHARRMDAVRAWTAVAGLAAAFGPVAGGLLTQLDWRWVFLVNIPAGLAVLFVGPRVLPNIPVGRYTGRPDLFGATIFAVAIGALALGLVKSPDWGWTSLRVMSALALSVVLLLAFVQHSSHHPAPTLPLPLLKAGAFGPASLANLLFAVPFGAMLLSAVLWCQDLWHWTALRTGLAIAPGPLMVPLCAVGAGPLARRIGAAPVAVAGNLVFAAGVGWWIHAMGTEPAYVAGMLPGIVLVGMGVGLTMPTLVSAAVEALPSESFSTGSGVVGMARQLGSVLGIAVLVAILGDGGGVGAFARGWWFIIIATCVTVCGCLFVGRGSANVTDGRR